jgi:monoamine oxidase
MSDRRIDRRTLIGGAGKVVEVGGQWIGPTQDHLAALASELGVGTFKTYNDGNHLFYEHGRRDARRPVSPATSP